LIPGKVPPSAVQLNFIELLKDLFLAAQHYSNNEVLLFADPVHQVHNNENDYCWQSKGSHNTKTAFANSGRRRLNIIGAINPVNFQPSVMLTEENCCVEVMEAFLEEIKSQYSTASCICIVLDNAKYQRAYCVQNKAMQLNINLIYLPPYCPNLNLIERLWRYFKKKVMKNKYYETFSEFETCVEQFFINFGQYLGDLKTLLSFKFGIIKAS
jgi:DDE superfamily endonuclease